MLSTATIYMRTVQRLEILNLSEVDTSVELRGRCPNTYYIYVKGTLLICIDECIWICILRLGDEIRLSC